MGAAARAGVAVEFKATGVESVRNGLRLVRGEAESVGRASEGMSHGSARYLGEFARGLGNVASSGKVTALSMRELSGSLFGMSEMLGPAGILLPVLATLGYAIYEVFNKTREEIEKTRKKAQEELAALARSGDLIGLGKKATELYSGDAFAVIEGKREGESDAAFKARQLGQKGMEDEIATKKQLIALNDLEIRQLRTQSDPKYAATAGDAIDRLIQKNNDYKKSIEQLAPQLEEYTQRHAQAMKLLNAQAAKEGDVAGNRLKEEQRKFLEGMATKEGQSTLDNQFANHLFGVLVKSPKVRLIGELVTQELIDSMNVAAQKKIAELQPAKLPVDTFAEKFLANIENMAERIRSGIADSIGSAISAGFDAAFQKGANAGTVFAAIARSILSSMGEMFEEIGRNALIGLISMARIKAALLAFMPEIGIPLAIGLIAFGAFLKGSAGRVGANAAGGGGGGGGGSGYTSSLPPIVNTGVITAASSSSSAASRLAPIAPVQNTIYVIGDDPKAWRQVQQRLDENAGRG